MFHMLSCFNLKPEISINEFSLSLSALVDHMKNQGLLDSVGPIGLRDDDTPMDTDNERNHKYFFITTFVDKEQCDQSYDYILKHTEPSTTLHHNVYTNVVDPVFICFEDIS